MSYVFRKWFFIISAAAFSFILILGVFGLNPFGEYNGIYGNMINKYAPTERHAANLVSSVAYDYRGFDTLGEEFILFASVAGVSLLLREKLAEKKDAPEEKLPGREAPPSSEAIKIIGSIFVGAAFLFGVYMVLHAHLTPGGGFQGGVIIASSILLIYISYSYKEFSKVILVKFLESIEAIGMGGFILTGLFAFLEKREFLSNIFPLGKTGDYLSGGFILLINIFIGFAVSSGLILVVKEFLEQTILLRENRVIYRKEKERNG
jgi:multicomponent Na+:H+ antiporter subunit B